MKKLLILSLASVAAFASAQQEISVQGSAVAHFDLGTTGAHTNVVGANAIYSNVTNYTGFGVVNGGATGLTASTGTNAIYDDINGISGSNSLGGYLNTISFAVTNFNTVNVSARARIRFYANDGASGGPGTYETGFSFNAFSFGAGTTILTGSVAASLVNVTQHFWAAIFFDASGATGTTLAQLNNMGVGLFNPPDVGTSADMDAVGGQINTIVSNPTVTIRNSPFSANPAANYGWEFTQTPEPASYAVFGLGALMLIRRRRKS